MTSPIVTLPDGKTFEFSERAKVIRSVDQAESDKHNNDVRASLNLPHNSSPTRWTIAIEVLNDNKMVDTTYTSRFGVADLVERAGLDQYLLIDGGRSAIRKDATLILARQHAASPEYPHQGSLWIEGASEFGLRTMSPIADVVAELGSNAASLTPIGDIRDGLIDRSRLKPGMVRALDPNADLKPGQTKYESVLRMPGVKMNQYLHSKLAAVFGRSVVDLRDEPDRPEGGPKAAAKPARAPEVRG